MSAHYATQEIVAPDGVVVDSAEGASAVSTNTSHRYNPFDLEFTISMYRTYRIWQR